MDNLKANMVAAADVNNFVAVYDLDKDLVDIYYPNHYVEPDKHYLHKNFHHQNLKYLKVLL